jgi:hypothetical protein
MTVKLLTEQIVVSKRLGRHVHFDERSKSFRVKLDSVPTDLVSKTWKRTIKPFDQGQIGSCTGNGAVGLLATEPYKQKYKRYNEKLAVKVYSLASSIDEFPGQYPPEDTGSSVLASMKALQKLTLCKNYHWCLGLDDVLKTLSHVGPVSVGVNWYEGFDSPDATGRVTVSGQIRGGHCFEILGIDVENKLVIAENSWGAGWGVQGRFNFSFDDLDRLLKEEGEAATVIL